jgi:tetratricopeptide (TPR) repeat protein
LSAVHDPEKVPGIAAGLWYLWKINRSHEVPAAALELLQVKGWAELELLAEVFQDSFHRWESLCDRHAWCKDSSRAATLRAEKLLRRGQLYLALRALVQNPEDDLRWRIKAALVKADILQAMGLPGGAMAALTELSDKAGLFQDWIEAKASAAGAMGTPDQAMSDLERFHSIYPGNFKGTIILANLLEETGNLEQQAAVLLATQACHPLSLILLNEQAENLYKRGQEQESLSLLERATTRFPANPRLWATLGDHALASKQTALAIQAWRKATTLEPQNQLLATRLRNLSGARDLWEGIKRSHEWIQNKTTSKNENTALTGLADTWLIELHANGLSSLYRQQIIRVGKPESDSSLTLSLNYDPNTEEVTTLTASIYKAAGGLTRGSEEDDRSLSMEEYNIYYDVRQVSRIFEHLEQNDLVVWEYRIDQFQGSRGGFSILGLLQSSFQKIKTELVVAAQAGVEVRGLVQVPGEATSRDPMIETIGSWNIQRWQLEQLEPISTPHLPPPLSHRCATFQLTTMFSWQQVADWYRALLARQATTSPAMEAQIESLSEQANSLDEIGAMVADKIRYVGLEFGVNAYVPYPSAEVFKRRFGDCKDKSLLMITLLRMVGVEAYLAVVRTSPRGIVENPLPSISLFDHAIVYLPGRELWFDPTARFMGLTDPPWQDQGAQALIMSEQPRITTTPIMPATSNQAQVQVQLTLEGTSLLVQVDLLLTGARARESYDSAQGTADWDPEVERYIAKVIPGFILTNTEWQRGEGISPRMDIHADGYVVIPSGANTIDLLRGRGYQRDLAKAPKREFDLVLPYPFEDKISFNLGPGLSIKGPKIKHQSKGSCSWAFSEADSNAGLDISLNSRWISMNDYDQLRACLRALDASMVELELELEPELQPDEEGE